MKIHTFQWLTWVLAAGMAVALGVGNSAQAQTSENGDAAGDISALHISNSAFAGQLSPQDVARIVDQRLKERDDQKKQEEEQKKREADAKGYVVGSDMSVKTAYKDGSFLWFETPNKDFTMHIGGWVHLDNVWWAEPPAMAVAPGARPGVAQGVANGAPAGGVGPLQDGVFFRRIRIFAEGTFWENGEYRLIPALENTQFSQVGLDEFWVGAKNLPFIGTARVGHFHPPMGLEGDMTASSRCMTFLERSAYSETIELNQNFVTGVLLTDSFFDQRATWAASVFRPDQKAESGDYFGNGQSGVQGRLTGLPLYEDEGRHLMHLAVSAGWRDGQRSSPTALNAVSLSGRPEMRDDNAAGSALLGQPLPNANSNKMIDTGSIVCDNEFLMGLEMLYIRGPFSLQAEYGWNWVNNAYVLAPVGGRGPSAEQDYMFTGGYLQLAYTLTGENRAYDRRMGTLAREYYGKRGPYSNAYFVRDENGCLDWSLGAWELAARYGYVNLNSGNGPNAIAGGEMQALTLGLNWYMNNNLNVMFDWIHDYRYNVPVTTATGAPFTTAGIVEGFGISVQFQY